MNVATCHCERSAAIQFRGILAVGLFLAIVSTATAKYSGGSGTAADPYQIATAADLILLGETPADYDKHFVLTADIDLDPRLPGRKVFDRAVIGPDTDSVKSGFHGTPFSGVFDGNAHTISHLTIKGGGYLGLFGRLGMWYGVGKIQNFGMVDVNITGAGGYTGGLVGDNYTGTVARCYSTGVVNGTGRCVGGLLGANSGQVTDCHSTSEVRGESEVGGLAGESYGAVTRCYSTGAVRGTSFVGGLVGSHGQYGEGSVTQCHSTGAVNGRDSVGGLVGCNGATMADSYSTGAVSGTSFVGGLVGANDYGTVTQCYSTGVVSGSKDVGGLVGSNYLYGTAVAACFWDTQTSGQATSAAGTGKTTAQIRDPNTFRMAGWDFVGPADGPSDIWAMPEGGGYPILWWQLSPWPNLPRFSGGTGEPNAPYRISTTNDLNGIGHNPRLMKCHFKLMADLDLTGFHFYPMGDGYYPYGGVFDGNGHTVSHLTIQGASYLGLFGRLEWGAEVKNTGVVDVNMVGSGSWIGGLVGWNGGSVTRCYSTGVVTGSSSVGGLAGSCDWGTVTDCYSTGAVSGMDTVGGLVGSNVGYVTQCRSSGAVTGDNDVGGLVGRHGFQPGDNFGPEGSVARSYANGRVSGGHHIGGLIGTSYHLVTECCNTGSVSGDGNDIGGLVGWNAGDVTQCHSTGSVRGSNVVGGLVGFSYGGVTDCYSTGAVSGSTDVGGFAGRTEWTDGVNTCFWDVQTSGQTTSVGGTGKTTAQMQTAKTFLDAGWDFVGETKNGTEDIWWILEGKDYPKLWWELTEPVKTTPQ